MSYSALACIICVVALGLAFLFSSAALQAQASNPAQSQQAPQKSPLVGLPIDWMSRHILFTNGGSPEVEAAAARDPHYWINAAIRHLHASAESNPLPEDCRRRCQTSGGKDAPGLGRFARNDFRRRGRLFRSPG